MVPSPTVVFLVSIIMYTQINTHAYINLSCPHLCSSASTQTLTQTQKPHAGEQPKNSKFASIKWTDAPNAVVPAYGTVFKCAIEPNAFSPDTLAYTPDPKVDGCYPLTLTVNVIFHHSYANLQVRTYKAGRHLPCIINPLLLFNCAILTLF